MKQHTTGVAKVVNPLGTVVTIQSDSDNEVELPEDIVIHENCDEALFRPVVASKALAFAEPKIITNALPDTQTAIVESPSFKSPRKCESKIKTVCSAAVTNKNANNQPEIEAGVSERTPLKLVSSVNKSVGISGISTVEASSKNYPLENMLDFDFGTFQDTEKELHKSKEQICAFSDPFDDLPEHVDFLTETEQNKKVHKYHEPKPSEDTLLLRSDKDSTSSLSLATSLKKNIWHKKQSNYIFDDPAAVNDLDDAVTIEAKAKNDKYQGLDISEVIPEEKQMSKKPRKPKTKLGVRLSLAKETEKTDIQIPEEAEPPVIEIKKSWSSIASCTPKSKLNVDTKQQSPEPVFNLHSQEDVELVLPENDGWDKSENLAQEIDISKLDKSDDEKQENNSSQTETTESDDSSKAPALLIAMDTEEDSCQTEIGRTVSSQNVSKSGNKKKPKKKRR